MYLQDVARIIWKQGTASMNTKITVQTYDEDKRVLWKGKAKELHNWNDVKGWIVVEILVDKSIESENHLPDYNKGKIITVL